MINLNATYNRFVWCDIPVIELDRAIEFYESVLRIKVQRQESDGVAIGVFDSRGGNSGCLIVNQDEISSNSGVLVYLNVDGRIRDAVHQAEDHGGKVIQRIHSIDPYGYRAVIVDCEGNRIALHSTVDA